MTNEGERNKSRSEFDNTYFSIDDDIENLIDTNFGLKENELAKHARYQSDARIIGHGRSSSYSIEGKIHYEWKIGFC